MNEPVKQLPDFLRTKDFALVADALEQAGGEWRVVGGAVRDYVLDLPIEDIDLVCNLDTDAIELALNKANIKTIAIGKAFGVIQALMPTAVMPSDAGQGQFRKYEIACLRKDVSTDGRHAVITAADDWQMDSGRRDFTINALYMDGQANISDYHVGLQDIERKILRFIGDANQRIQEDYLRIMRLFRFYACLPNFTIEAGALEACYHHAAQLHKLSAERICQELRLWLMGASCMSAIKFSVPIWQYFPQPLCLIADNYRRLPLFAELCTHYQSAYHMLNQQQRFLLILALLTYDKDDNSSQAALLKRQLRLANHEEKFLHYMCVQADFTADEGQLNQQLDAAGQASVLAGLLLHRVIDETLANMPENLYQQAIKQAMAYKPQQFPLTASMLLDAGLVQGELLGKVMHHSRAWWAQNGFTANATDCLAYALKHHAVVKG